MFYITYKYKNIYCHFLIKIYTCVLFALFVIICINVHSFMSLRPMPVHRAFGLSVCVYVRPSVDQVKIFVQGRISRPINGSKLVFHMRIYVYENNRKIQKPWPPDLYFAANWLRTGQIIEG